MKIVKILPGIELVDLALWVKKYSILTISDVHIGYEAELMSKGVLLPRFHFKDTIQRLEKIFRKIKRKIKTIIITGDLKHEFGRISEQEWKEIQKLVDYLSAHCEKIILLKGNHDVQLGPVAKRKKLELVKEYKHEEILFIHGDYEPKLEKEIKIIIMGHEHPAVTIRHGAKYEKYKCYLLAKYQRRDLIVQPSFNPLTEGTDVLKESLLSPILKNINMNKARVFVVASPFEILNFGTIRDVKELK